MAEMPTVFTETSHRVKPRPLSRTNEANHAKSKLTRVKSAGTPESRHPPPVSLYKPQQDIFHPWLQRVDCGAFVPWTCSYCSEEGGRGGVCACLPSLSASRGPAHRVEEQHTYGSAFQLEHIYAAFMNMIQSVKNPPVVPRVSTYWWVLLFFRALSAGGPWGSCSKKSHEVFKIKRVCPLNVLWKWLYNLLIRSWCCV